MPRKRRADPDYGNRTDIPSGAPPQAVTAAPDQAYGEAGAQRSGQQAMPLPNEQAADPMASAMSAAQQTDFQPVGLGAPSARPWEPVQAGLPNGPGPGPEAIRPRRRRASDVLDTIAAHNDDDALRMLAENARRKGR